MGDVHRPQLPNFALLTGFSLLSFPSLHSFASFSFVLLLLLCLRRFLWIRSDLSREHRNPSITSDLPSVCVC